MWPLVRNTGSYRLMKDDEMGYSETETARQVGDNLCWTVHTADPDGLYKSALQRDGRTFDITQS